MFYKSCWAVAAISLCVVYLTPSYANEPCAWLNLQPAVCCDLSCEENRDASQGTCVFARANTHVCGGSVSNHVKCRNWCREEVCNFRLTEFNIYPTFSYLSDQVGNYTEFEFTSQTEIGWLGMENHTVFNVADLPSTISLGPTNPGDPPTQFGVRGNGFGDVLSGFFFSRRGVDRSYELGIGPVITFPTASNDIVGARQWTIGPGVHFSKEFGPLTAGFFLWQSWKVAGSSSSKRVNQLFGKPFMNSRSSGTWYTYLWA